MPKRESPHRGRDRSRSSPPDLPRSIELGRMNRLRVRRLTGAGALLGRDGFEVLLPRKEMPPGIGIDQALEVFLHLDSEDRPIATVRTPRVQAGHFACLEVKAITRFGAFLDWGLEKDLLLPFAAQAHPIRATGRRIVVHVDVDPVSGRMVASTKLDRHLPGPPRDLRAGQSVELLPYQETDLGFNAIVDQSFKGLIHRDASGPTPVIGEHVEGFVRQIREDGRVDLSLRPSGFRAVRLARDVVLDALEAGGGQLQIGDKSPPEIVRSRIGLSKKAFKKALGALYREGAISMTEESVQLRRETSRSSSAPGPDARGSASHPSNTTRPSEPDPGTSEPGARGVRPHPRPSGDPPEPD